MAFHNFLDGRANVGDSCVGTGFLGWGVFGLVWGKDCGKGLGLAYLESSVGGGLYGGKQVIVDRIGSDGEGAVDNPAVYVNPEIHGKNVVVLEDDFLGSWVGRPVGGDVVQAESGRESHAGFQGIPNLNTLVVDQCPHAVLDLLRELAHGYAGFRDGLHVLADLAVDFGGLAVVVQEVVVHVFDGGEVTEFFGGSATEVCVPGDEFDDLAEGIWLVGKESGECDSWGSCLLYGDHFLLLSVTLLFLLLACGN